MTASECIEAVGRMLNGYPNARDVSKSYIGLMAGIFIKYPRSVVIAAVEPDGIPLTTKFVPTPSDVIGWLQRKIEPMYQDAEREKRVDEQLRAREEWLNLTPDEKEIAYRKQLAETWLKRSDPRAVELSGQKQKQPLSEEEINKLMADAKSTASRLNSGEIQLSNEAIDLMLVQDKTRAMDG